MQTPAIGVIGGSGLYHMEGLTDPSEHEVETPWDAPPEADAAEVDVTDEANTDARLELPAPQPERAALRRGRR